MLYCLLPNQEQGPQVYNLILLDFSESLYPMTVEDGLVFIHRNL